MTVPDATTVRRALDATEAKEGEPHWTWSAARVEEVCDLFPALARDWLAEPERTKEAMLRGAVNVDAPGIVRTFRTRALRRALNYRAEAQRLRKVGLDLARDLLWEREEHDKARTEWLLMRDRLNGLREACENAISQTEPPSNYEEPWCSYEGEIEAAPWSWLQTLIAEALDDFEPFDHESWQEEEEKRKAERQRLVAERDAARADAERLTGLLQEIAEAPRSGYHDRWIREAARAALAAAPPEGES